MKAEIYKDEGYKLMGAAFEVYNDRGYRLGEEMSEFIPERLATISAD